MLLLLAILAHAAPLRVDDATGALTFHNRASLHAFDGRAKSFRGSFDPATGRGELVVPVDALTTGLGPRDARMRGYVLDGARFPEVRVRVTGVVAGGEVLQAGQGSGPVTLAGELTLREVTRPVQIPTTATWEGSALRLAGRVELRWTDWGLPDPSVLLSTLYPDMSVEFDVVARPPDAAAPGAEAEGR